MFKINAKLIIILSYSFLIFDVNPSSLRCLKKDCLLKEISVSNKLFELGNFKFLSNQEKVTLEKFFSNILVSEKLNQTNQSLDIVADTNYSEGDIFYAEGNVQVTFSSGILNSDKISYDKEKKIFVAEGNVNYRKGNQFFKANFLEYDLTNNKGVIKNIYGVIDLESINSDLKFQNISIDNKECLKEEIKLLDLPAEINLLGSSNLKFKNKLGLDAFELNFSSIRKWRFKSEEIILGNNDWKSDLIFFTNDPFNSAQFILKSKNFKGEIIEGKTKLQSKSTFLDFDDKLSLPIGRRTISDNKLDLKWGLGYETRDKDGLYIFRNFEPISIGDNFSFDITPYFLVQRALNGKSNAFRAKDSSTFSNNLRTKIDLADYFALNTTANLIKKGWNLNANSNLKTLNTNRFYDAFSLDLNILKTLYQFSKKNKNSTINGCVINSMEDNESESFFVKFGGYLTYDNQDIYKAIGTKIISDYNYKNLNLSKNYSLIFDFGSYEAKSIVDNSKSIVLNRNGLSSSFIHEYKILDLSKSISDLTADNKYTPEVINQGLFINSRIGAGFYNYGDFSGQRIFSLSVGPKLVLGEFKNKFFDYTSIYLSPEFNSKRGKSPFTFDDFADGSRMSLSLKQQLIGPLVIAYNGTFEFDGKNDLKTTNYSLEMNRRAYKIELSYYPDPEDKRIILGFEVFNFGYDNYEDQF